MTRKILTTIALTAILLANPSVARAQYYGQGEVLGEQAPEEVVHEPVEAGIEDYFNLIGFGFIGLSGLFYHLSKKTKVSVEPVESYEVSTTNYDIPVNYIELDN